MAYRLNRNMPWNRTLILPLALPVKSKDPLVLSPLPLRPRYLPHVPLRHLSDRKVVPEEHMVIAHRAHLPLTLLLTQERPLDQFLPLALFPFLLVMVAFYRGDPLLRRPLLLVPMWLGRNNWTFILDTLGNGPRSTRRAT